MATENATPTLDPAAVLRVAQAVNPLICDDPRDTAHCVAALLDALATDRTLHAPEYREPDGQTGDPYTLRFMSAALKFDQHRIAQDIAARPAKVAQEVEA